MSHRDEAIKEVAEAMKTYPAAVEGGLSEHCQGEAAEGFGMCPQLLTFSVAKAERCLVLEEALRSIHKRFTEADQGTLHVRDGVARAMDSDARAALEKK